MIKKAFFIIAILIALSASAQVNEDIEVEQEYSLIHNQLDDLLTAWDALLVHKDVLESQGYALKPKCFTHSRFKWTNIKTGAVITNLTFATKKLYPEGCANIGTFRLTKHAGQDSWECKISGYLGRTSRDCHLGPE